VATEWDTGESSGFRAALGQLTDLLVAEESFETVLQRIIELACSGIGACDLASITYMRETVPKTIVSTDPAAVEIDQAQYSVDDGPCLEAYRTRSVISVPSMAEDDRWEPFRTAAMDHGVQSSFSLPLATSEVHVGALNLYARKDHAFNSVPPASALLFAKQAAAAVWSVQTSEMTRGMIGHLEQALANRDLIGMAKGIIMTNEKVSRDQAFKILATASQHRNIKLHEIAAEVVDTGITPG
jgi:GAF domain-containing protein